MAKIKRIVCYAVNGSGLGHVTRLMSIARWLRRYVGALERRTPEILFLTSSEATQVLLRSGFASFKLPSKTVVRQAGMDMLEYRRLARLFVWQTLGTFSPDLLVVDTFPAGSFDELIQLLDGPFHKGFIHRRVKPEYGARPTFQAALGLYDTVVIPHAQPAGDASGGRGVVCGEVLQIERESLITRREARARLKVPENRTLVYVSAGGGGDPESRATLSAIVEALGDDPNLHLLVGAGPLYQGPRMGGPQLTWFTEPEVAPYMAACDVAISAGGYNTFHELLHLGVPSVFYAQDKVADDQAQRIQQAADAGACLWLGGSPTDPVLLRDALRRALDQREELSAGARARVPESGAARCARALLARAYEPEQLSWAERVLTPKLSHAFESHGQEGRKLLAQWLPRLLPSQHVDSLRSHPSFVAVVSQLSDEAAEQVRAALLSAQAHQEVDGIEVRLLELLEKCRDWPGGVGAMTALVDNAAKKHPPAQDPELPWLEWLERLLTSVSELFDAQWEHLDDDSVRQIYRVFPKIVDAGVERAFEAIADTLGYCDAAGGDWSSLVQKLRALKFANKRVTLATLEPLAGGPEP